MSVADVHVKNADRLLGVGLRESLQRQGHGQRGLTLEALTWWQCVIVLLVSGDEGRRRRYVKPSRCLDEQARDEAKRAGTAHWRCTHAHLTSLPR